MKVWNTNSAYNKWGVVGLLAALKYLVEEGNWVGFVCIQCVSTCFLVGYETSWFNLSLPLVLLPPLPHGFAFVYHLSSILLWVSFLFSSTEDSESVEEGEESRR